MLARIHLGPFYNLHPLERFGRNLQVKNIRLGAHFTCELKRFGRNLQAFYPALSTIRGGRVLGAGFVSQPYQSCGLTRAAELRRLGWAIAILDDGRRVIGCGPSNGIPERWSPLVYGCGSKPMLPFWGRCTTHFSLF